MLKSIVICLKTIISHPARINFGLKDHIFAIVPRYKNCIPKIVMWCLFDLGSIISCTPSIIILTFSGIPNDASLRPSNSRAETLNHARLRSGYDQLYRATPTCDPSLPKAKMSTSDYNQLNLHSSAA